MTYRILSTRQSDVTLITSVEYNFDGELVIVDVPHFMPQSQAVIEQNIINNAQSELVKIQARQQIENLIPNLPVGQEIPINP